MHTTLYTTLRQYLLVLCCLFLYIKVSAQLTLRVNQTFATEQTKRELVSVLKELEATYSVSFIYQKGLLDGKTVDAARINRNEAIEPVLDRLLSPNNLRYRKLKGETAYAILPVKPQDQNTNEGMGSLPENTPEQGEGSARLWLNAAPARQVTIEEVKPVIVMKISGIITDENNEPLPGVSIKIKDSKLGTITNTQGEFALDIPEGNEQGVLQFSLIGYEARELALSSDQTRYQLQMFPTNNTLEEYVVVGYGQMKKSDVIGSISTVNPEKLPLKSAANFDAGLQGMAAGVSVQSRTGAPGSPSIIKIRGTNSINSSTDPLWIIDGMPVYSNPWGVGSSGLNPMSLINSNDIASIQILKDAAATAIYGSRASNGVIIVTTKSGKKGEGTVNLSVTHGRSTLTRTPEEVGYTNTQEWFSLMDKAYQNSLERDFEMNDHYRFSPQARTQLTREQAEAINTDWYSEMFRIGSFSDYNLSASQGFDKGAFFVSGNFRQDRGVQRHNNLDRYSLRANLDFSPIKNLFVGTKLNFANTNNERRNSGTTSMVTFALPWFPVREPDNAQRYFNPYTGANPTALNDPINYLNNVRQYRGLANLSLQYHLPFVKGLSLKTEVASDVIQSGIVIWESRDIWLDNAQKPASRATEEAVTFSSFNYNGYATLDRQWGDHTLNVVSGVEAQRSRQYNRSLMGQKLTGRYQELGTPTVITRAYGGLNSERYLLGYFARGNYRYKNYLMGLSARRDGSSTFTPENRWGTFLALSAGWIISEERWLAPLVGKSTFLKLRGSYGETGNQDVISGLDAISYYGNVPYGGQSILAINGTLPTNLPVSDLTWETTRSTDVGIDFGFMDSRINGSVAYYHRLVDGMLLPAPVPVSAGVSSPNQDFGRGFYDLNTNSIYGNLGIMVNSGVELELASVNFRRGHFRWSTEFNISFNRNIIQQLTSEADQTGKGIVSETTVSRSGQRRNEWMVADYAGVDVITGVPMIYALDKEVYANTGETVRLKDRSGADSLIWGTRTNIRANRFYQKGKSADPKYYGGLNNTFQYKAWEFSFMLAFSGGNYILDYDRQIASVASETRVMLSDVVEKAWEGPGDEDAVYPKLTTRGTYVIKGNVVADFGDADVFHNRELYRGDFVRLRNVQLAYTLPEKQAKRLKMKGMRCYVSGSNLMTFTRYPGFDPEGAELLYYSSAIPQLKSIVMGIDFKF
jgi:TonB-dependent starch-binding outer membrane protein SusC